TDRLILRTWQDGDSENFYAVMNTLSVMRWLGGVQTPGEWAAAKARLDTYQSDYGHTFWIVEDRESGELFGFCGLKRVNAPGAGPITGEMEIGWRLRESAWRRGIAKESAIAAMDLAFDQFKAPHVVALTVAGNGGSWGLMRRLGMTHRPEYDYVDPRFGEELNPTIVYRMDAADWPKARALALA
ncbi:MAG: GNAT family N-acetyltransferase, partial [Sphingomicrobium sp.]